MPTFFGDKLRNSAARLANRKRASAQDKEGINRYR